MTNRSFWWTVLGVAWGVMSGSPCQAWGNAVEVEPQRDARAVSVLTTVTLKTTDPAAFGSLVAGVVRLWREALPEATPVKGTVRINRDLQTVTFQPLRPLEYGQTYRLEIASPSGTRLMTRFTTFRNPVAQRLFYRQGELDRYQWFRYDDRGDLVERLDYAAPGDDQKWFTEADVIDARVAFIRSETALTEIRYRGRGADRRWRTADDEVASYHRIEYGAAGEPLRRFSGTAAGADGRWFTEDDVSREYVAYFYGSDRSARVSRRVVYASTGKDGKRYTADDVVNYYESYFYSDEGKVERLIRFDGQGKDRRWFTSDDVIDSYNQMIVEAQWRGQGFYRGPGDDGKWLTADDVLHSYRKDIETDGKMMFVYFTGPGADGIWRNDDDEIRYYTVYEYNDNGHRTRFVKYDSRGPDKRWFTRDDGVATYSTYSYNSSGSRTSFLRFSGKGADGIWFTADDEVRDYETYEYDRLGNRTELIHYQSPGPDRVWFSSDDTPSHVYRFNTGF